MEELTHNEKLLIFWALGFVSGKLTENEDLRNSESILRKLKT